MSSRKARSDETLLSFPLYRETYATEPKAYQTFRKTFVLILPGGKKKTKLFSPANARKERSRVGCSCLSFCFILLPVRIVLAKNVGDRYDNIRVADRTETELVGHAADGMRRRN